MPEIDILRLLRENINHQLINPPPIIKAIWRFQGYSAIDSIQISTHECTEYAFILTLTEAGLGCAYWDQDLEFMFNREWLGKDARGIQPDNKIVEISILDSIYSAICPQADEDLELRGAPAKKAAQRAQLVRTEIQRIATQKHLTKVTVLNIGAVGRFISELASQGMTVHAVDLDTYLIGKNLGGIKIMPESFTPDLLLESDIVLATGMTLSNGTLNQILDLCSIHCKSLVIFAETGANFGSVYCKLGVDTVISETFPFYTVPGRSRIRIFRRPY